ncbi:MAG: DUF2225 domain-containing protein [Peptococcaceae bacterium]|nr:DUF2225 domain-containing protein [Peptococcaceae bacterium]
MNTNVILNFFKTIPLFQNLGPVLLARLAENAGSLKFNRGDSILEEGRQCNNLFIVASGKLELYKRIDDHTEIVLQTLNRGEIFGEAYALDGSLIEGSLRAAEDAVVIGIDRLTLHSIIKDNPEFSRNYIRFMGSRAREALLREDNLLRILLSSGLEVPEMYSIRNPNIFQEDITPSISEENQETSPEDQEEGQNNSDVFFKKEYACPLCSTRFQTLKLRQRHIMVEKTDPDFCMYYKTENPLYYEINVCPKCGYSFNSSTSGPLNTDLKAGLAKVLAGLWKGINYCALRTLEDAVETFKLAIECQRYRGADDSVMGKFFLKLGWLYRYQNMQQQERQSLDKALHHLSRSFEKGLVENPKEEINLMFLLGQLHLTLGDERGAINWFIKITQHPEKKSYPYMINRARNAWQEIRNRTQSGR